VEEFAVNGISRVTLSMWDIPSLKGKRGDLEEAWKKREVRIP
jgi:hypothetical protein